MRLPPNPSSTLAALRAEEEMRIDRHCSGVSSEPSAKPGATNNIGLLTQTSTYDRVMVE